MDIDRVILFISSFSQNCAPCLHFIQQHGMPVSVIRLDTAGIRERVRNGRYFQISNVPTLLVTYTDGNLQLFQGQSKILEWLNKVLVYREEKIAEAPPPSKKVTRYPSKKYTPPREEVEGVETAEEGSESEEIPPPPKAKVAKKKKPPVKFKSTKKSVEEEGGDIELITGEDVDSTPTPAPKKSPSRNTPNHLATGKSKNTGMASLVEQARKMEQERKSSLGYDEKNLPRY